MFDLRYSDDFPVEISPLMVMTPQQVSLVRQSFDSIRDLAGPLSLLFYGKLFELEPSARRMFHNDLRIQGQKLMDMLHSIVDSLDRFDSLQSELAELVRRHASYGVQPSHYDSVETALLWALAQAQGPDFDPQTRDAWPTVISAISQTMKSA